MPLRQSINYSVSCAVHRYLMLYPREKQALTPLTEQLAALNVPINSRKALPGHITASGLVSDGHNLLLIFHPYLQKWLQPGGHTEEDEAPKETCIREVSEETGLKARLHPWHQTNPQPFDINIHTIPANPKKQEPQHLHYDFRYLLQAGEGALPKHSELAWAWRSISDIKEENLKAALLKLALII